MAAVASEATAGFSLEGSMATKKNILHKFKNKKIAILIFEFSHEF